MTEEEGANGTLAIDTESMDICNSGGCVSKVPLKPIGIPIPISEEVSKSFQAIEAWLPVQIVVFGFDYSPGNAAEMEPQALAILEHLAEKQSKGDRHLVPGSGS